MYLYCTTEAMSFVSAVKCIYIYLQVYKNNHKVLKNNHICFAKPIYLSY